jgi:hypothetical protein
MTKPCDTCPYRRSTPVGVWDEVEYENLRKHDADTIMGHNFNCHLSAKLPAAERSLCVGWLADQKRRGFPAIQLRMLMMRKPSVAELVESIDDNDPDLYSSIEEMCRANAAKPFPKGKAGARVLRKLKKK